MTKMHGFNDLHVAAFESRMAQEMENLIARHGGQPLVAPSMQEIPLEDNPQAFDFGEQLLAGQFDMVIALTGAGLRSLVDVLKTRFSQDSIKTTLANTTLVARGPKPTAVLKELGLTPEIAAPEPNTWRDLLQALDTARAESLNNLRIAVQEYGVSNTDLVEALRQRGAIVTQVPVYRWALPDDTGPLRKVLATILAEQADVMLITNAVQVDHIMQILEQDHQVEPFRKVMEKTMVASIGQIASERLRTHGLPVDLEPSHPKMGILVKEASQRAAEILQSKRAE